MMAEGEDGESGGEARAGRERGDHDNEHQQEGDVFGEQDLPAFEAQASTNLVNWETLTNALSLTNGSLLLRDPNTANLPQRYYRVVEH